MANIPIKLLGETIFAMSLFVSNRSIFISELRIIDFIPFSGFGSHYLRGCGHLASTDGICNDVIPISN